ncbi:MAG: hypothetical protein VCA55_15885, partial [Verrucomicrobiales bacterium]
ILMARFVMFGRVNKMGCVTTQTESGSRVSKLFGHMLALPLSKTQVDESYDELNNGELPRKRFAKYAARICFIGDGKAYQAARELTWKHEIYEIDVDRLKRWMLFMGQDEELRRFTKHEAVYREVWADERRELESMTCFGDTATFSVLNERASSDVARMTPQIFENDSATQQGATGGFENYVLTTPMESTPVGRAMRLKWIKRLVEQNDPEADEKEVEGEVQIKVHIPDRLMNEFEENDRIIFNLEEPLESMHTDTLRPDTVGIQTEIYMQT